MNDIPERFVDAIFDLANKYDLPLTNNEPHVKHGHQLWHIGDFIEDVWNLVLRERNGSR